MDINPSQVISQQMLVLIYLPWKDGKLSWLRQERMLHKSVQILAELGIELGTLWVEGRDLTNCTNHAHFDKLWQHGIIKEAAAEGLKMKLILINSAEIICKVFKDTYEQGNTAYLRTACA